MRNRLWLVTVCLFCVNFGNLLARQGATSAIPEYKSGTSPAELTIDNSKHNGFSTPFDFPTAEIKKGWWKYLSSVARVKNRKTYWILTVPPKKGESTEPVVMFSAIKKTTNHSTLTLVLDANGMDAAVEKDYLGQIQKFLTEFKAKFYGDYIQERIVRAEKEARTVSKQQQKYMKKAMKLRKDLEKEQKRLGRLGDGSPSRSIHSTTLTSDIAIAEAEAGREGDKLERIKEEIDLLKKTLLTYKTKAGS